MSVDKKDETKNKEKQTKENKGEATAAVNVDRNKSFSDRSHGRKHESPKTKRTPGTL